MEKTTAITLLGGSIDTAAKLIRVSYHAVHKWPAVLPDRIEDRVIAAIARRRLPAAELSRPLTPDELGSLAAVADTATVQQ